MCTEDARPGRDNAIDPLTDSIERINAYASSHGGGIELTGISSEGVATVRFTGMCTGCPCRHLTLEATVRPALNAVPGVAGVAVDGGRISEEAQQRLRRFGIAN